MDFHSGTNIEEESLGRKIQVLIKDRIMSWLQLLFKPILQNKAIPPLEMRVH